MRLLGVLGVTAQVVAGLENGLVRTPPMGTNDWNSLEAKYPAWTKYGFNASAVLGTARALVSTGLRDKGYTYVNIDCGWTTGFRDSASGALVPNATLYPGGLALLAKQINAMNLQFGIYTSGKMCCGPQDANDGIVGHEATDVAQLHELGFTFIKNDDCGSTSASFGKARDAILNASTPMVHSIHTSFTHGHPWPDAIDPSHAREIAHTFRTTPDIRPSFDDILDRATRNDKYAPLAGPGYFNDPDMLEVGIEGVSDAEGRSHMALWSLIKAPLLIGCDLTTASDVTLATLGAVEVIKVNQDALGAQGRLIASASTPESQVWAGPLTQPGCYAVVLLHVGDSPAGVNVTVTVDMLRPGLPSDTKLTVRDLWNRKDVGIFLGAYTAHVPGVHDNAMLKVCGAK